MEAAFWGLLFIASYSYFIYPLCLVFVRSVAARPYAAVECLEHWPSVSLIIAAHNEQHQIAAKLDNALALDYPADKLEIIVVSDGSGDDTDEIVATYEDRGIKLIRTGGWLGKERAQLMGIEAASGSILVFSDAGTQIAADAVRRIAAYFEDPDIAAVSSEDRFLSSDGSVAGEGLYVQYEMGLRRLESELGGLVGLSGSFFAARAVVVDGQWDVDTTSDFNTAFACARRGRRAVTAPDVLGYYRDLAEPSAEYRRKVRTVIHGIAGLMRHRDMLNTFRYGWFSFQLWSHKVSRWVVPWALILLLAVNLAVYSEGAVYRWALWGQLSFYGIALAAHMYQPLRDNAVARIVYFFVLVNISIAEALIRYLSGQRMVRWKPSVREG